MPKLTKTLCDRAAFEGDAGARCVLWDSELRGFGLRVYPSGRKAFILSYRRGATKRLYTVGAYGVRTVDEARKAARLLLAQVESRGADPVTERKRERAEQAAGSRVRDLLASYQNSLTNDGTRNHAMHTLGANVPATLARKRISDVTADDVRAAVEKTKARGAGTVARHLYQYFHAAFEAGRLTHGVTANPVAGVAKPEAPPPGERVLADAEIRALWAALDSAALDPQTTAALRLLLLTGQRVQEILGASWGEVDTARRVLDIPPARLKSGKKTRRGHIVPLGDFASAALGGLAQGKGLVFPLKGDPDADRPMPYHSLTQAVARLCSRNDALRAFTPRDIRRSVKTKLSEIGVAKDIRDRAQGHALHDVASRHYDRFDYLDEKRAALVGWEWELRRILAGVDQTPEWRKWLRRFVREPDDDEPGERLRALLEGRPAAAQPAPRKPPKRAAKGRAAHA